MGAGRKENEKVPKCGSKGWRRRNRSARRLKEVGRKRRAADKGQAGLALHPMMMAWGRSLIKCFETHNLKSSISEFESVLYQLSDSLNLSSLSIKRGNNTTNILVLL